MTPDAGTKNRSREQISTPVEPPKGFFPGIQILRGAAAMLVVLCHTVVQITEFYGPTPQALGLVTFGMSGVDIFFVISGFIITFGSTGASAPNRWRFLANRAIRIYPLYWLVMTAMLSLTALGLFSSMRSSLGEIVLSYLLAPVEHPVFPLAWTLTYEMFFYALMFGTYGLRGRPALFVATNIALLVGFVAVCATDAFHIDFFRRGEVVMEFCAGMLLALAYRRLGPRMILPTPWALALGLFGFVWLAAGVVAAPHAPGEPPAWRSLIWGPGAAMIVFSALSMKSGSGWGYRTLLAIGDASYSIYLTHVFLIGAYHLALARTPLSHFDQTLPALGVMALSALAGLASYRLAERPLLVAMRRRLLGERRSASLGVA
ncbi:acyltransferase family protein [Caulobacter sp.]|uniref:acyltransferase family protein n=1 Tax=Caulobacter sp. TaxID=78 RepID=UPI003D0EF4BE